MVCHDILITKLYSLGIRGRLLDWITDFLHERKMKVIVSHRASEVRNVRSGVPQGSVLGPLLFLFYVNFLTNDIVSSTKIFADDLKLYIKINTANNLDHISNLHTCQTDFNTLAAVSRSWASQ